MNEYLIFRIYGMMASWGDVAVGEFRPSFDRPSKSAVMGMVAAALGIRRDEEERLRELATGYCMAVRIDAPGILMRDYHTAQVPSSGKGRNKLVFPTRKAELSVPKDELNTILSSRDYRCDAVYSVCLWSRTASSPYPLTVLKQHLEKPVFGLYLGRKSCPLALPLQPQVVRVDSLSAALSSAQFNDAPFIGRLQSDSDVRIFWEGNADAGFTSVHTVQRRDDPLTETLAVREPHGALCDDQKTCGGLSVFISKVKLRHDATDEKEFWNHIGGAYKLHSLVWDLFADAPERSRDFIYRQDLVEGLPAFYCVSVREPNDRHGVWGVETKPYAPVIKKDQRLSFMLRANPIRSKRDEKPNPDGKRKQHRHDVVMEAKTLLKQRQADLPPEAEIIQQAGFVWLAMKGEANGFSLMEGEVRADGYIQHRFTKPKGKHSVTLSTIEFTGLLTVTDPELFVPALFHGLGPAKGFGCGLMMVRPVR